MKKLTYLLILLMPIQTFAIGAGDLEESYVVKAKAFIKEYPLIETRVDELGMVDLWQRIKGLHNLINVWNTNEATFHRAGPDELRSWNIYKRIHSHRSNIILLSDDEQVAALSAMIRLHASFADRYMEGEIKYAPYAEVASYVESYGRSLAEKIEEKYGNGKKILKPEKGAVTWQ